MPIARIVSGGQTGADRGGLEAAICCNVPHGGWCPKGRRAEDGIIPVKYKQKEMTYRGYVRRTEANVVDSDATVIFTCGELTVGSNKTAEFARKHNKPLLLINLAECSREEAASTIVEWLQGKIGDPVPPNSCVLNVAGSRESLAPGNQESVKKIMIDVLILCNPECRGVSTLP